MTMTVKSFALTAAAAAAIGVTPGAVGVMPGGPAAVGVQLAVTGTPLPLQPAPALPADQPAPEQPAPAPGPAPSGAPLPTPDEVSGMLTRLSDAGISYKEKGNLVENGITQEDGHVLDHELRKAYRDGELPYTFNVLNVVPTGPDQAVANVTISGPKMAPQTTPLQLVDQGGWVLSQDTGKQLLQVFSAH